MIASKKSFKIVLFALSVISVCLLALFLINLTVPKIVHVQEIRVHPEQVDGEIGVIGKIVREDDKSAPALLFDLEAGCKAIPVIYKNQLPESESEVIAFGQFREVNKALNEDILWWEYVLEVDKIKMRKNILSGNLLYKIRLQIRKVRKFIYNKIRK
jgi:hypothetical protein